MANINRAKALIDEGRLLEAREIVVEALYQNYDNLEAWLLLTQCTRDRQEYGRAIREILRIDPDNEQARTMAMQLSREGAPAGRALPNEDEAPRRAASKQQRRKANPARVLLRLMVNLLAFLVVIAIAVGVAYVYLESQKDDPVADKVVILATIDPLQQCAQDVPIILGRIPARCPAVVAGEACLINPKTVVQSKTGPTDLLNLGGDRMELTNLVSLETMSFNTHDYTWGTVYMRGLASFPPEANEALTVVVTSGVIFKTNDDASLSRITFSSNPTPSLCPEIAPAGLLVSVPITQSVAFEVNGEAFLFYGTAFLQVDSTNGLRIVVLEGQLGLVDRQGRTIQAGQWAKIDVNPELLTADDNIEVFETAPDIRGNMASLIPLGSALGLNTGSWQSGGGTGVPVATSDAPLVLPTVAPTEAVEATEATEPTEAIEPTDETSATEEPVDGDASPTPLPPDQLTPTE